MTDCSRCTYDRKPDNFGSPRSCAFKDGVFSPDNWSCGTLDELASFAGESLYGDDETMQIIPILGDTHYGWIVLNRYKTRGTVSSAMHVGDFWPAKPLTLDLAQEQIHVYHQQRVDAWRGR